MITAEDVLPGHPDRVCDAVAEGIVTHALRHDPEALVGVEVALHRRALFVTGRVAASDRGGRPVELGAEQLDVIVAGAFADAGYTDGWTHPVQVVSDLDVGGLDDDERGIRCLSDDQGIAVGHADPDGPHLLPVEAWAARRLREALAATRAEHPGELGPDGKVLVALRGGAVGTGAVGAGVASRPGAASRPVIGTVNVAIQHVAGVGYPELLAWLAPHLADALDDLAPWIDGPARGAGAGRSLGPDVLRVNGIGDFTCGGPMGDNGLSGKKLVVDHYGPQVPIGGGAICGKDVHKPDRVGALRARQLAVRLARATGQAATVHTGFLPGLEAPDRLHARLGDGRELDADAIAGLVSVPDLTLAGSARDLELAAVDWPATMRTGYFGSGQRWER
jgi:S-adenosylmethionine synthetase